MKTLAEKIKVMQAALDGKEIEILSCSDNWVQSNAQTWDWCNNDYRIKQEPVEFWVNVHDSGYLEVLPNTLATIKAANVHIIKTIKVREVIE